MDILYSVFLNVTMTKMSMITTTERKRGGKKKPFSRTFVFMLHELFFPFRSIKGPSPY